jgi:A/G-specific adenine glycosylase
MNENFRAALLNWFDDHGRNLPWRTEREPYKVWLSEIILQQTRVEQGSPYFHRFLEKYPSVLHLAAASEDEVLRLWQGLGYYSRGRNLLKTARIVAKSGGQFPSDPADLRSLPGIGPYTAAAISSIAFGQVAAAIDGNVVRIMTRLFGVEEDIRQNSTLSTIKDLAEECIPSDRPGDWNEALMDLGSLICTPRKPKCDACPLSTACIAFEHSKTDSIPYKSPAPTKKEAYLYYFFLRNDERIWMTRRDTKGIWAGLYESFLIERKEAVDQAEHLLLKALNDTSIIRIKRHDQKHLLTHRALFISCFLIDLEERPALPGEGFWASTEEIESLALPRPLDKVLKIWSLI